MAMADFNLKSLKFWETKAPAQKAEVVKPVMNAHHSNAGGTYNHIMTFSYDGEKNLGEIGPIRDYVIDHESLRLRSWQAFLESEIAQTVLKKFTLWVIGPGLKLQSEPVAAVLQSEGIAAPGEDFNESIESRFSIFAGCVSSDYSGMNTLHAKAEEAYLNAIIGGDVLVVLRYINNSVKVQLIDGAHVQSPIYSSAHFVEAKERGNKIVRGIEISAAGEHVAFHVRVKGEIWATERIEAKGKKSGLTMAFLVYGQKYRLDTHRGMPLIATVLETLKKLERYKEATVGSAEERQKIAYFFKHGRTSDGENPVSKNMVRAYDLDATTNQIPIDEVGNQLADTFAATTNKTVINMPIDSEIVALESKNELYFKDFYTVNIDIVCATVGIPPNVAMSKYDSNFSASRAALKDWEHTMNVNRKKFADAFYQKIYNFFFEIEVLKNKISAPGYLQAKVSKNYYVIDAYRNARWIGPSVPHIDPVKEVEAERAKLGAAAANIPLTTVERATEVLNGGDSVANVKQFAKELEVAKKLEIIPEAPEVLPPAPNKKPPKEDQ